MATSGVGRGRGWLNLNTNTSNRPGNQENPIMNSTADIQKEFDPTPSNCQPYPRLTSLLNQLNVNDDGILLNQKVTFIKDTWSQECTTCNEVKESCKYVYEKCLDDEVFANKIVMMISSYTFISVIICRQKIRNLFVGHIQDSFEGRKQLQATKPDAFRIAIKMLCGFYIQTTLSRGQPLKFLVKPLLSYFEMLLDSAQPADLELFTMQLYLSGSSMKNDDHQKLNELINKARLVLICKVQLTQTCKLFLLLAIDIANNRYGLLPPDILKFYQEQLGDKVMAHFQGPLNALSIETQHSNKMLDSYESTINVLQVTPPDSTSPVNDIAQHITTQSYSKQQEDSSHSKQPIAQNYSSHNFNSDSAINVNTWESHKDKNISSNREKTGRPILGAGARFQKAKGEENSNWRERNEKESSSGWNQKSWFDDKKEQSKNYKGWEHDDRFENDYN